jgi:outer membrane protein OmpA-like peptidoglycan-associated protein
VVNRTAALAVIAILAILLIGLGIAGYAGYRHLDAMGARVEHLSQEVHRTGELAEGAAQSARASDAHATESAERAEAAAGARTEAEQLQKQAEVHQSEAENAARQARQQASQARDQLDEMRRQREAELNHIQEVLNQIVSTHRTPSGLVVDLPDSTFKFAFDSADLSQKNRELLSRIAGILLVLKGYGISVYGYTDDVGDAGYNQKLSLRRAQQVRDYLVEAGISSGIVSVKGFGKTSPLVPGTSEKARARNRRVEIALTDTLIKYRGEAPPADGAN